MSYSRRSRYSRSPSYDRYSKSVSRSRYVSRSRSRSCDSSDVENPGNNLYVTGLSTRVKERDVEKHFSAEGKVEDVRLVFDPWTRESRGFGFVTMSSVEEADRCIKSLNRSVLEGRVITVEKARRRRGRTPTPGKYLGLRTVRVRRESGNYPPHSRSRSPCYSSESYRSRSYSPYYRQEHRSYSYYRGRQRSHSSYYSRHHCYSESPYSPYYSRGRSYSRSLSPYSQRDRSYSPDDRYYRRSRYHHYSPVNHLRDRSYSPDDRYNRRGRYRDYSPERRDLLDSPDVRDKRMSRYRDYSPNSYYYRRNRYRSISRSISPRYRRSYSCSASPRWSKGSYSRSVSRSSCSRSSYSPNPKKSSKKSCSVSASSRFVSRSVTPRSSPSS
ncbi:serine/arginine-rich splicing factor SR45a-like [Solanum verrucosum]|uniref:serine/arginine-rich splicing factor SR45a-like n=1 Tax=Solanum verrucosum TaxID=315347 RepID=UPI0020D07FC9|nr:serine/arginine-rich splicing factor SR45a-like [Solanum verrucosum]